jgi:hypothetical protein
MRKEINLSEDLLKRLDEEYAKMKEIEALEKELNKPVPYAGITPDRIKLLCSHGGTIESAIEDIDMLPEEMGENIYAPYVLVHLNTALEFIGEKTPIDILDEVYHWCDAVDAINFYDDYRTELKRCLNDYAITYPERKDIIDEVIKVVDMERKEISKRSTNKYLFSHSLSYAIPRYKHFKVAADDLDADE